MKSLLIAATLAGGALFCLGGPAHAATRTVPGVVNSESASPSIQRVDDRCRRHEHWVPSHWEHGHHVEGHCE